MSVVPVNLRIIRMTRFRLFTINLCRLSNHESTKKPDPDYTKRGL